jgi:hypothetical protein
VWYDTTRIFVEVYQGRVRTHEQRSAAALAGVGVIEIPLLTFLLQLTTIRAVAKGWRPWSRGYVRFVWFFSQNLAVPYWLGLMRRIRIGQEPIETPRDPQSVMDWARVDLTEPVP